jgi:hypothetical protein
MGQGNGAEMAPATTRPLPDSRSPSNTTLREYAPEEQVNMGISRQTIAAGVATV